MKQRAVFIAGEESRQLVLMSELPESFQGQVHKDRVKEGDVGHVVSSWTFLLILLMVRYSGSTSSTWFQLIWGLCACGQHEVNFSHLVGFHSAAAKHFKGHGSEYPLQPLR